MIYIIKILTINSFRNHSRNRDFRCSTNL